MSIAELKLKVIEKLTAIQNEEVLNLILDQLNRDENKEENVQNLSQHFDSVSKRYDKTLKKLAR